MRKPLPNRRASETFSFRFQNMDYTVTVGFYDELETIGEVFINGAKSGAQVEAIVRDGAILASLAIQHGVPLETISHAVTRDGRGEPQTIVGAIIDGLIPKKQQDDERTA